MSAECRRAVAPGPAVVGLVLVLALLGPPARADGPELPNLPPMPDVLDNPLKVPFVGAEARPPVVTGLEPVCGDPAAGQDAPLSLSAALDTALCNNAQLRAAWAAIRVQAGSVGEMQAGYLPRLNLTLSRLASRTDYPDSAVPADQQRDTVRNAALSWRLFDFGAREANLDLANQLLSAAIASRSAALHKLMSDTVGAYFEAVTAQAVLRARDQAVQLAQSTLDVAIRREAHGTVAGIDVLQGRAALAKAQLSRERARSEAGKAAGGLLLLMGLPPSAPLVLPAEMDAPQAGDPDDLAHWLNEAQASHPSIAAARAQLDAARAKVAATRAEGLPSVEFSYTYNANGFPNQGLATTRSNTRTYGLVLSVPLFEGFARTYKVRGVQAQVEQQAANLQHVTLQVSMDVLRAHADAVSALSNLHVSATLVEASEQAAQSSARRYDKGVADIMELLSAQGAQSEAHQERVRCLADWHAARLRLLAAAGQLTLADAR